MIRSALVVVALAMLSACGGAAVQAPPLEAPVEAARAARPSDPLPPPTERDADGAVRDLRAAYEAYIEGRDVAPIFALWAPELEVVAARARTRSDREAVFDRARFKAIYTWAARYEPHLRVELGAPRVERRGERVVAEWTARMRLADAPKSSTDATAFGERYELERRADGWKVVRFRYWPLTPTTLEEFGAEYFAELDGKIAAAQASGNDRTAAYLLMLAYRFDECVAASKAITKAAPTDAWAWHMRATASAMAGDLADAEESLERSEALTSHGN